MTGERLGAHHITPDYSSYTPSSYCLSNELSRRANDLVERQPYCCLRWPSSPPAARLWSAHFSLNFAWILRKQLWQPGITLASATAPLLTRLSAPHLEPPSPCRYDQISARCWQLEQSTIPEECTPTPPCHLFRSNPLAINSAPPSRSELHEQRLPEPLYRGPSAVHLRVCVSSIRTYSSAGYH